jgi:hypothetical protein
VGVDCCFTANVLEVPAFGGTILIDGVCGVEVPGAVLDATVLPPVFFFGGDAGIGVVLGAGRIGLDFQVCSIKV